MTYLKMKNRRSKVSAHSAFFIVRQHGLNKATVKKYIPEVEACRHRPEYAPRQGIQGSPDAGRRSKGWCAAA